MTGKLHIATITAAVLALTALTAGNADANPPIEWRVDEAIALGSGCNAQGPFPDTAFIKAGNEMTVVFSRMGVDLTPGDAANTAVQSCLVRVPITVDADIALAGLRQELLWGYSKDYGTEAEVSSESTFMGIPTTPIIEQVGPDDQGVVSFTRSIADDDFIIWEGMDCPDQPHDRLFQMNLAVAARREETTKDISVRIAGEDIKFNALADWTVCP